MGHKAEPGGVAPALLDQPGLRIGLGDYLVKQRLADRVAHEAPAVLPRRMRPRTAAAKFAAPTTLKRTGMIFEAFAKRPTKLQWSAVLLGLVALAVFASPAYAAEFRGDEGTVRIGANETVDGDLFVAAQSLEIYGTVNGDVFSAGANTTVRGTINGSLSAAGQTVRIEGPVANGVRAAAAEIVIAAPVGRDLLVAGESLRITDAGKVGGDAVIAANDVALAGDVEGRVLGFAERLRLTAAVGEYVDVGVGSLEVDGSALIGGDLKYQSANQAQVPTGSVAGSVLYEAATTDPGAGVAERILNAVRWGMAWIVAQALLGLLLFALARGWLDRSANSLIERPWVSLLAGGVSSVAAVPVILLVSIVLLVVFGIFFGAGIVAAIPVPVFGLGALGLALYVSPVIAALVVGRLLMERLSMDSSGWAGFLALLVGLAVLAILGAIPYLGLPITALAAVLGLGGGLLASRGAAAGDGTAQG